MGDIWLIDGCKQRVAVRPSGVLEACTVLFLALLKIRGVQEGPPLNDNFLKVQIWTSAPSWALPWMCD